MISVIIRDSGFLGVMFNAERVKICFFTIFKISEKLIVLVQVVMVMKIISLLRFLYAPDEIQLYICMGTQTRLRSLEI